MLATPALILHSIIISFVAAWLACDTAPASSVHSLQEMTNRAKDEKTPFGARGSKIHHVSPQTLTKSSVIRDESAPPTTMATSFEWPHLSDPAPDLKL